MKLDLSISRCIIEKSFYCVSTYVAQEAIFFIIGADETLHKLIWKNIEDANFSFSSEVIRNIHKTIPGHYALIKSTPGKISVATDPYAIIKLYWYRKNNVSFLCDNIFDLKKEVFELDSPAIKYFFVSGYTPSKHTFFKEVSKLEPCSIYNYVNGSLSNVQAYAQFGEKKESKTDFLDKFTNAITAPLDFYYKHYKCASLLLSGGMDSSFLYKIMKKTNKLDWIGLFVSQFDGMNQSSKIDNDYDIEYSQRLSAEENKPLNIDSYSFSEAHVLDDFKLLQEHLFTEYAPAMAYAGLSRKIPNNNIIINGQNADSILSFGSQGSPRFQKGKISGLHGFFSRYFHFFGQNTNVSATSVLAKIFRSVYYKRACSEEKVIFSERNHFLGMGMIPGNNYYIHSDPCFSAICEPEKMADWFTQEYLTPLSRDYGHLDKHAQLVILYNKTYMQGSANRHTVLSSLVQGGSIFLPYTTLDLLELMTSLKPDWHYAYYGKYPNVKVGKKKLGMPNYIMNRCDPNDSGSSSLLLNTMLKNNVFVTFLTSVIVDINLARYENILSPHVLEKINIYKKNPSLSSADLPWIMKLVWLESLLNQFKIK